MDESSQGSVELLESVEMVPAHVEKLGGAIREEDLHSQYIAIQRVPAGPGAPQLLTADLMQGQIQQHLVEEFSAHGEHDYYEGHILQEHELADTDRHLAELQQAVVEEPQNLSAPVSVVGDKPGLAAMVSAYIHTTGDLTGTHQIIIDTSERGSKLYQQRLPSLSSLPPLKKALPNSSIRSRYQRPSQSHHSMENEVTLSAMTSGHHTIDGTNVIVVDGQHLIPAESVEGQRILEAETNGHALLVEDPITQKLLQESSHVSHRLITADNQRILVAQDATAISHSLSAPSSSHRLATVMNGHQRALDVHTDQNTRFLTHQEASVVTSLASQRLLAHTHQIPTQVQSQAELDMTERLLDEESPDHQMLVQEQLIHVVLDPETQEQLGVVSAPGQRVLVQGPGGQWTEIDAASCEAEVVDHDSRDTTLGEVQEQEETMRAGLIVKHEEVELADSMGVGDADGLVDGMESVEGVADGSDGDVPVEDMNDSDYDVEGDMRTSRRSLPHKKRLSRKLRNPRKSLPSPRNIHAKCYKCNKCGEQFGTQASYASHRATHTLSNKKTLSFSCEICGKVIPNQLKFFEHLKAHYEPRSGGTQVNCSTSVTSTSSEGGVSYARSTSSQRTVSHERNTDEQSHLKESMQGHIQSQQLHQPQSHNLQVAQMSQSHHPAQQPPAHHQQHQQVQQQPSPHHQHPQQPHHRAVLRQTQHHQQRQPSQQSEMQTIILKVEDVSVSHSIEKSQGQIHMQEQIQELHHIQNHRQRSSHKQQDPLQTIQHHPRSQQSQQSGHHQPQQSSVQQTLLNSEPSSIVPILPPVSTITGPVNLNCNLCGKVFRRQKTYETHLSVAHPKQEDIEQFSEPEDMMEGIRGVVEAGEDSADDADSLVALTNLTPHSGDSISKSHSGNWYHEEGLSDADLQSLQQSETGSEAQPQAHLQQSEVSHMCDLCGDTFLSKHRLHQHVREEHLELRQSQKSSKKDSEDESSDPMQNKKALRRLACPQCDRVFNHRNSLVYHLRSHSGERPHRCEECGKSFFATSALKVHMRLHSGDKPYKCEFCDRSFRQWGDLKYHCTSKHSEEKQYQCEYCGKDFARKYSLIVHRRIHTGEKNYVCEFCNKQFRASSYLQNHRRIHTGEKPHRCEVCNKPFRVRSDMKRHLNTHNRDRQRVGSNASNGPLSNTVRENNHKMEVADADGDAQDSSDMQSMHNLNLHDLGNGSSLTIVKADSEAMDSILPDSGNGTAAPSAPTQTSNLSAHTTDEGLQYTSERDPLDTRSQSATHLNPVVWVIHEALL